MTKNTTKQSKDVYEIRVQSIANRHIKDILKEIIIEKSKNCCTLKENSIKDL